MYIMYRTSQVFYVNKFKLGVKNYRVPVKSTRSKKFITIYFYYLQIPIYTVKFK